MPIQNESNFDKRTKFLSLREAAQLYGYTRDHLGLMIRRGRLKGVRLGNYYATSADWMAEYVINHSDSKALSKNKFSNKFRAIKEEKPYPVQKIAKTNKAKIDNAFSELQKDVAQALSSEPQVKMTTAETEILPSGLVEDHGLVILPVRKMKNFERQMILSQAKNQENS